MRDILRRNLGYKLISLILAMILWVWITSLTEPVSLWGVRTLDVPLVINNQPSNLVVVSNIPSVTVKVNNNNNNNNQGIDIKNLYAYVDLSDATAGEHSFQVYMDPPEGVEVESISPSNVVLRLDTVKDKIVPIIVEITGKPAAGYLTSNPIVTPPVVNVRGPTSILEKLEEVTVQVDVTGAKESMRVARPVSFKDMQGSRGTNLVSLQAFPNSVEIIVPVYAKGISSKMVPLRVNTRGLPASGMTVRLVTPLPSQVQMMGDEEALKNIQQLSLGTVDVTGLSSNKVIDIPLNTISLPEGVSFTEGTSISVMVYIGPEAVSRTIKDIPVGIRNIPHGLSAEPIPSIEMTVNGYPDILDSIRAGDISAWVDAAGLKAGEYPETKVLWNLPSGMTMVDIPEVNLVLTSLTTEVETSN